MALPSQLSFSIALAELIPNKWRGYNNALLFFMAVPFSVFGPIIARNFIINTAKGWRWSYYINLILTGLAIVLALVFYHPPIFEQLHIRASKRKVLKELDYVGILLFVAGLVLFLIGLSWGGVIYPWTSARTLSTLLVGLALFISFFVWELYGARAPFLPPHFLKNLPFAGIIMAAGSASAVFYPLNISERNTKANETKCRPSEIKRRLSEIESKAGDIENKTDEIMSRINVSERRTSDMTSRIYDSKCKTRER
ncbi:hypothetical protein LTR56_008338 [Elasticomyces elasticus]|nr:hypothetical protein LTR56_008338 [Elasticomyces elasticus]KAK3661474.1 hypothetical protein LTR22_007484 [Elasticomyces elasticus]KAK4926168.1 hypothetical protein LTR49_006872 [Elasticomyces elasticus]KAK5756895.1 hypothetical protein LTS12_012974 [Elasticomyces elasticus]